MSKCHVRTSLIEQRSLFPIGHYIVLDFKCEPDYLCVDLQAYRCHGHSNAGGSYNLAPFSFYLKNSDLGLRIFLLVTQG